MKVVPDTMMWVSYATHADGARSRAIERAIDFRVRFFTSEYILAEVERTLHEKMGESRKLARLTVASLRRICTVVPLPLPAGQYVAADPGDDLIVQTALTGKADCIITADKLLLELAKVRDVEIISLEEWLSRLPPDD
jgi:putative PIN family toxin of toxin-antitoxin system